MLTRVGMWCFRRRALAAAIWGIAVIVLVGAASTIGARTPSAVGDRGSESQRGFDVFADHFGGVGSGQVGTIVFTSSKGVTSPAVSGPMQELFDRTALLDDVIAVISPYNVDGQISADGTVAFATVEMGDLGHDETTAIAANIDDHLPAVDGLTIELGSEAFAEFEPPESELIGLAFAVLVLIFAFGSVLAMGLPIGVAIAGVGAGISLTTLYSNVATVPSFATTIGAMIGLGVGIDYALFIVTRYREGLHAGQDGEAAMELAMRTAARAVVFAGFTVVLSLAGLLLIGLPFIAGLGVSAALTVLVTMVASVTLLPALLGVAGARVEVTRAGGLIAAMLVALALFCVGIGQPGFAAGPTTIAVGLLVSGIPSLTPRIVLSAALGVFAVVGVVSGRTALAVMGVLALAVVAVAGRYAVQLRAVVERRQPGSTEASGWYRWSRFVQARPWPIALLATLLLVLLALPLFSLRLGFPDEGNYPESRTTRRAYDLLADGFGPGFNGPILVVGEFRDGSVQDLQGLADEVAALDAVAMVSPLVPNDAVAPDAAFLQVIPASAPQDVATEQLVRDLRDVVIPANVPPDVAQISVTGTVAAGIDFSDYLAARTLLFFAVVLALSFLLLLVVFRSLLVPLKAVAMNVLSIAAAYGVVIAAYQWGWGEGIAGIPPGGPIEPFMPMMLFAIVFGLSMDYEVFLLSRMREAFEASGDPVDSVAEGLASTARVITAAAAIMVVVFGSFVLESDRTVKVFGSGLAIAVFLDATLVRMLLVPATMQLLGGRNWWLPAWLDRILPQVSVEEDLAKGRSDEGGEIERLRDEITEAVS